MHPTKDKPGEKIKFKIDDNPSPGQYAAAESFRASQIKKPTFFLPKEKLILHADKVIKEKSYLPGVGFYNVENAFDKATRGLSRGWK
jgi:hypothetical protein